MTSFLLAVSPLYGRLVTTFGDDKRGVTMLEYGLIAALIAAAGVGAVTAVGNNINTLLTWFAG